MLFRTLLMLFVSQAWASGFDADFTITRHWSSSNHPKIFFQSYETNLDLIPVRNSVDLPFWSDDYWPRFQGGIAYRWQNFQNARSYSLLTKTEVLRLSPKELNELSPAEKFDLIQGNYDFDFTKKIKRQNPSSAPGWQGICHGWAEANLHHAPPQKITKINRDQLEITFYPSDVAALLSYYYAKERRGRVSFLGRRCRGTNSSDLKCQDVNPGAFHIVIAETMKRGSSIIADVDPGPSVWNHPLKSYDYEVLTERAPTAGSARGTVREVFVEMDLEFLIESYSSKNPIQAYYDIKTLKYWLELDEKNQIIGGRWKGDSQLDFLWFRSFRSLPAKYKVFLSPKTAKNYSQKN